MPATSVAKQIVVYNVTTIPTKFVETNATPVAKPNVVIHTTPVSNKL